MPTIHPTALVSDEAQLADDVTVGPFAIIDGPAMIGPGCEIGPHVWLHGLVEMGSGNKIGFGSAIGTDPQDISFDLSIPTGVRLGNDNTLREHVTMHRATAPDGWTTLGNRNFVMVGCHFGHDLIVGDHNIFANNVLFGGHIRIGNRAFVGGGAGFHQFLRIGDLAFVQGNSSISKDVPPYCFAYERNTLGALNVIGLRRAGFKRDERSLIKAAYALLFQSGLTMAKALEEADTRQWSDASSKLLEAVRTPSSRGVLNKIVAEEEANPPPSEVEL